jgi:putative copper resistance protein D
MAGAGGETAPVVDIAVTGPHFYTTPAPDPKLTPAVGPPPWAGTIWPVGLTPVDFFTRSRPEPVVLALLVLMAVWYGLSTRKVKAGGRDWPTTRKVYFAGAVALVAVADLSGLHAFAATNFSAYGTIYIAIGLTAPAFLALAAPLQLMLLVHPGRARGLDHWVTRVVLNPFVTWILFSASMFVLFFTGLFGATLRHDAVAQAVYGVALLIGYLHYLPVADVDPVPRRIGYWPRILYQLLIFPVYAIVGMGLESQVNPIYPGTSLGSLHLGAAVLWVAGETLALSGAIAVFSQWLRADQRRARAYDVGHEEAAERQLALWRASRDAAARAAGPLS